MKICVFGASGRELDRDYYEAAEGLGALIAGTVTLWCSAGAGTG